MKKFLALLLAMAMVFSLVACGETATDNSTEAPSGESADAGQTFTVGICQLVQHEALDAATKGFIDALTEAFGDKVTFLNENASNDVQTCTTIINNFVNKKVDLIMANATPALQAAANGTDSIPVLGTSITEYGTALGIENFSGTVGGNISGTSDLAPLTEQVDIIFDLFPDTKKVALLFCTSEANSAYQIKVVKEALEAKGVEVDECSFTDSNDVNAAAQKAAGADVIYIPTDNTAASCATMIDGLIGDTPAIVGEEGLCAKCGVATLSISYYDLGKTTGEMAAKILKGEAKVEEMPIEYTTTTKKFNKAKCEQLKIDTKALEDKGYVAIEAQE